MKEFYTVLLGQQLKMYTDHENITYKNFNTDRMLQWIIILEEYGPNIEYILGKKNIAADVIARLPNNVNQNTTHETTTRTPHKPVCGVCGVRSSRTPHKIIPLKAYTI